MNKKTYTISVIIVSILIVILAVVIIFRDKPTGYEGFEVEIDVPISVESVSVSPISLTIESNASIKLDATITPDTAIDKKVTWESSNPIVAKVDQSGYLTGIMPGEATIIVTTRDGGKQATMVVTVISSNKTIASYDSKTLKYWVEYIEGPKRTAYHYEDKVNNQSTFILTHIWVDDPYNQIKTAITTKQDPNQKEEYPRNLEVGSVIINREIENKQYQDKGLIAINGGGMISHTKDPATGKSVGFYTDCPLNYYGTSYIPYQLYDGKVVRDSTNVWLATIGKGLVFFIDKDGNFTYKKFTKDYEKNKTVKKEISDLGGKYTFGGLSPYILIDNYEIVDQNYKTIATRQAICQIDKNNFLLITSHLNGQSAETSCGEKNILDCPRVVNGLTINDLVSLMLDYNCKLGLNLDGGGSVSYYYKTNTTPNATTLNIAASERTQSDLIYFVEK